MNLNYSHVSHSFLFKKSFQRSQATNSPQFREMLFLLSNCLSKNLTIIYILPRQTFYLRTSLGRTQDSSLSLSLLRLQEIQKSSSCRINLAHSSPFLTAEEAFDPSPSPPSLSDSSLAKIHIK